MPATLSNKPDSMQVKRNVLPWLALLAVVIWGLRGFTPAPPATAPDITLTTLQGQTIRLADLRGKPVYVTFWATSCPVCVAEVPDLIAVQQRLAATGFTLLAVAMAHDRPDRVLDFAQTRQLPYAVALDPLGKITAAFGGVYATPTSFLIKPDGQIAWRRIGRIKPEALAREVQALMPVEAS